MTTAQTCQELGFTEQSYYRWRKEYGGLQISQAKRLKELQKVNVRLRKLVADLSLDNVTPADMYFGRYHDIMGRKARIKQQTLQIMMCENLKRAPDII